MYRERGYNEPLLARAGAGLAEGVLFVIHNWKLGMAIIGLAALWINRETPEEKARKPQLISQVVINSVARCPKQTAFAEKSPYDTRLKDTISEVRSTHFEGLMRENTTICLDQRIANFNSGLLSRKFYAAYYYNDGEPYLTLRDEGKSAKDAGLFDTRINTYSEESIRKLSESFKKTTNRPDILLAFLDSEDCGDDCTNYFIRWIEPQKYMWGIYAKELNKTPEMKAPPLLEGRPALKYDISGW